MHSTCVLHAKSHTLVEQLNVPISWKERDHQMIACAPRVPLNRYVGILMSTVDPTSGNAAFVASQHRLFAMARFIFAALVTNGIGGDMDMGFVIHRR